MEQFNKEGKRRIKLLLVITKSNWGGAQRYVYDIATHVPKNQFDVSVVCGGDGELVEQLKSQSIRVIQIDGLQRDISIGKEFKVYNQLKKIFKEETPDIVHLNSSKIGGIGALAGRMAGVPKILFTAHGWAFNEDRNVLSKFVIQFLSWITILLCHKVITISYREQKQALEFPLVSPTKVQMIYIGIPHQTYLPQSDARRLILERTNKSSQPNTLWIGSLGELNANKGHIYALEAIRALHENGVNVFYCIIGEGEKRSELEEYIRTHNMQEYCVLPGSIPTDTSGSSLLQAFTVFLFPSIKEGLPFAVLEAMQARVPVVATNIGGIPEIIESKKTGLLMPPKDVLEIIAALEYVLFDERIQNDFGTAGVKTVQETFSFETMIRETILEYEN